MPHTSLPPETLKGSATQWSSTSQLQTKWDWRAVANFIGGGTGAGLLLSATLFSSSIDSYRVQAFAALLIIAFGLVCIMLKIGRPTRAFNIFNQVKTSWMTREGFAMVPMFGFGMLSLFLPTVGVVAWLATTSALFFLYCQALILLHAKGIPAWSHPAILALIVSTGLVEGAGLGLIFTTLQSGEAPLPSVGLLVVVLVLRHVSWMRYRSELAAAKAPPEAISRLEHFGSRFVTLGQATPALLLVAGIFVGTPAAAVMTAVAALLAAAFGWSLKNTIITRAAYYQRQSLSLAATMAAQTRSGA